MPFNPTDPFVYSLFLGIAAGVFFLAFAICLVIYISSGKARQMMWFFLGISLLLLITIFTIVQFKPEWLIGFLEELDLSFFAELTAAIIMEYWSAKILFKLRYTWHYLLYGNIASHVLYASAIYLINAFIPDYLSFSLVLVVFISYLTGLIVSVGLELIFTRWSFRNLSWGDVFKTTLVINLISSIAIMMAYMLMFQGA